MPHWLFNQLLRAFYRKDRRQIKLLNDCWFFYRTSESEDEADRPAHTLSPAEKRR